MHRIMKPVIPVISTILTVLFLTGCWDKVELENRAFVISIGVDKYSKELDDAEEENSRFTVTMAVPDVVAISEKKGGESKKVNKASGTTLASAMRLVDSAESDKLYYGHTKMVVFGEEVLKDSELLRDALDYFERNPEITRKVKVMAAEDRAEGILKGNAGNRPLVGMFIGDYYRNNASSAAMTIETDMEKVIRELRVAGNCIIPGIRLEEETGGEESGGDKADADEEKTAQVKLEGASVIKDFRLSGELTNEEIQGVLWILGKADGAQVSVVDNEIPTNFSVIRSDRKIRFSEEGGELIMNLNITADGSIEGYRFGDNSLFEKQKIEELEEGYEEKIKNKVETSFSAFTQKNKTDAIQTKELLKKWNYELYKKYEADFENAFSVMELRTEVEVSIVNIGAIK